MTTTDTTYRTVTPYFILADAEREMSFLRDAFGAVETLCHRDGDGRVVHAEMTIGDSLVMLGQATAQYKPQPGAIYLWVDNVDAIYEKALAAGARSQSAPEDKPYGHRNAGVIDANGITWWIGAPVRKP